MRSQIQLPKPVNGANWIALGRDHFALVSEADFERCSEVSWTATLRGLIWYAVGQVNKNGMTARTYLHRFVMDAPSDKEVDHINGDGLDCRRTNLRVCTSQGNNRNRRNVTVHTSEFKGVSLDRSRNKWRATIKLNRKLKYLGRFDSQEEAAKAYDAAAIELFGEFARPNFPCV